MPSQRSSIVYSFVPAHWFTSAFPQKRSNSQFCVYVCVRVARRAGRENAPSDSLKRYEVLRSGHVGNVKIVRTRDYSACPVAKKNTVIK